MLKSKKFWGITAVLGFLGYLYLAGGDSTQTASTSSSCTVANSKSTSITVSPYLPTTAESSDTGKYEYTTMFYIDGPGELTVDIPTSNEALDTNIQRFDIVPDDGKCDLRVYLSATAGKTISLPVRIHGLGTEKTFTWKEINGQPATLS